MLTELMVTLVVGSFLKAPGRVVRRVRTGALMNMVSRGASATGKSAVVQPTYPPGTAPENADVSLIGIRITGAHRRTGWARARWIPAPNRLQYPITPRGPRDLAAPPRVAVAATLDDGEVKKPSSRPIGSRIRPKNHPIGCLCTRHPPTSPDVIHTSGWLNGPAVVPPSRPRHPLDPKNQPSRRERV